MENACIDREARPVVKFNVKQDELKIYTLAKANWYGGNPGLIYAAPIDEMIKAYDFEIMSRQYKSTMQEMSKKSQ